MHEPIIDRTDFENVQRILENAPVKRPNGDGEIHPLSGLLFCKDCGAKMHIRIDYRNGSKRHVAYCSEYHKGKAKNPKCHSPHIMDADLLMQTVADVLKKIAEYSISNRAEFEALVKKSLAMQQTDQTKKQQKRIPQITTRLEQIEKVLNKLYEDNALGTIPQDRYEQMSQKYSEEYYMLKTELAQLQEQLSAFENAGGRAQKFLKLTERYAAFTDLTANVEVLFDEGSFLMIDCNAIENLFGTTMRRRSELDWLIYNEPLSYVQMLLDKTMEEYLHNVAK